MDKESKKIKQVEKSYKKVMLYAVSDPSAALCQSRQIAEIICNQIFFNEISQKKNNFNLNNLIQKLNKENKLPALITQDLDTIRRYGNLGCHDQGHEEEDITTEYIQPCLNSLSNVIKWYAEEYNKELKEEGRKEEGRKEEDRKKNNNHNLIYILFVFFIFSISYAVVEGSNIHLNEFLNEFFSGGKKKTFTDPPCHDSSCSDQKNIGEIPKECKELDSTDKIKCIMKTNTNYKECSKYKNSDKIKCVMMNKNKNKNYDSDCSQLKDESKRIKCFLKE